MSGYVTNTTRHFLVKLGFTPAPLDAWADPAVFAQAMQPYSIGPLNIDTDSHIDQALEIPMPAEQPGSPCYSPDSPRYEPTD
jgi:hypothetical protein